jgi:arylformamidase
MKIYDLSQDLNQDCSFWPFYPPFEVKYIKRKSEHGVNAQYIQTSNHMGTHLDAPRHFVTKGKTIDQIPIEWCYGPGVIVDLSDMLDDVGLFTPEDIEKRADVQDGDILFIHTGWHRFSFFGEEADEERYIQRHPGPHFSICDWLLSKKIHIWGVDMISTDHPMNLPIGRFLGKGGLEHWQKVRAKTEAKFGADQMDVLFPDSAYQLTHNALFPHDCIHVENLGGDIGLKELHNKRITLGVFPWMF